MAAPQRNLRKVQSTRQLQHRSSGFLRDQAAVPPNLQISNSNEPNHDLEKMLQQGPGEEGIERGLEAMKRTALVHGIEADSDGMSQNRTYIWLILLNVDVLPTDNYLHLIHRGPSPAYAKIRNDTFRTLATDPLFKRRVSEASLIRLLNALAWTLHDAKHPPPLLPPTTSNASPLDPSSSSLDSTEGFALASPIRKHAQAASTTTAPSTSSAAGGGTEPGIYVQGMNVLCAPFLYTTKSEVEAFAAFHMLLTKHLPGYIRGAMDGVHRGLRLVDKALAEIDPKLHSYLASKGLTAEIYAFPSVLTLCACTPPLPEVLVIWDFLFAWGVHVNILCIVAQLVLMREDLMRSSSPGTLLRGFPALNGKKVVALTVSFVRTVSAKLYGELVEHGS